LHNLTAKESVVRQCVYMTHSNGLWEWTPQAVDVGKEGTPRRDGLFSVTEPLTDLQQPSPSTRHDNEGSLI
jgi:hypothetical protein